MLWKTMAGVIAIMALQPIAHGDSAMIAPDRMLLLDGQRTFVLGLYGNPKEDAVLRDVAAAGFNLVHVAPDVAALDRLQQQKLHAWINLGANIDLGSDRAKREEQLRQLTQTYGAHPALLAWEVPDEALWNCWYGPVGWRSGEEPKLQRDKIDALADKALAERLKTDRTEADRLLQGGDFAAAEALADSIWRKLGEDAAIRDLNVSRSAEQAARMCAGFREGYALMKQIDPNHPVWMNHAPRNQRDQLAAFNAAADIAGCDIYPVPEFLAGHSDLGDRSLAAVGAYTRIMQQAAPGKPVWMVLQGFGWADLDKEPSAETRAKMRRPTYAESRFMAYDAIVRGARGILYWGTDYIEKDSALWTDLLKLVRELADQQRLLAAPDAALQPTASFAQTWGSVDRSVCVLAKEVDGKTWLIVVNEWPEPLQYTLAGLAGLDGVKYKDPRDAREAAVANGKLALGIRGHGVQILEPVP